MNDATDRGASPEGETPDPLRHDEMPQHSPQFGVLQQQLIDARDRLDREVTRLTRMHAFNAHALRMDIDAEFIPAVGEAIVDIFELEFGVFWMLGESGEVREPVGVLGLQVSTDNLIEAGKHLAASLARTHETQAQLLSADAQARIAPLIAMDRGIVAPCRDAQGKLLALLLSGNTASGSVFFGSISPELSEVFGLFAQQLAALIENRKGRAIIVRQMAEIRRTDQQLRLALDSNKAGLWDLELNTDIIELSSGWASLIGTAPKDARTRFETWLDHVPSEDQAYLRTMITACQHGDQDRFEVVHRLRQQDGGLLWVLSRGHVLKDASATPCHVLGTTFDISKQQALEAELGRERSFLRTLIRTIPDLVWLKDKDGVYLACNPKFESLYGAKEEDIVGKTDYDFVDKELADFFRAHDRAAETAGMSSVNEEELTFAADGHHELVETIKSPMYDTQGKFIGVLGVARDITQRRQAEEQIRKLSLAVEQSPSSIVITALDATIEYVNDTFLRTTGYSREEVIGQNPRILRSGKTPKETHTSLWQSLNKGQLWQGEFNNLRKDGSEYIESAIIAPIRQPDGRITHYLAIKEDITDKKRNAEELDRHRHHLMDLVAERTIQLAQAKDMAEAANRAKSIFLANMSHEIRTPMNAIIGLHHLLLRDRPTETQRDRLQKLGNSANHLLAVLNDVLDISKIESEKLVLDNAPFELNEVVASLEALIADKLHAKGLRFEVDIAALPGLLIGDRVRVSQVLLNYLGNAVKFTDSGVITLRGRIVEEGAHTLLLRFEVSDTGIGISDETRQRLFQAFVQADGSTTRTFGGTGLGLAINKRLAHLMGGEVGVESEAGLGSTFWITLRFGKVDWLEGSESPKRMPDNAAPMIEAALRRDFGDCRILLVEDDFINQEVALELLRNAAGLCTDLAVNGKEAVAMAAKTAYDLILMDMQMPIMDGLAATRAIRQLPGHSVTPILAMTANVFEDDRRHCLEAGMQDHVAKPVDPDRLFEQVIKWLGQCRAAQP